MSLLRAIYQVNVCRRFIEIETLHHILSSESLTVEREDSLGVVN
jgi:hypothetical protein